MASFILAIQTVLQHEGGFTIDHAGATNYGITLPTLVRCGTDIDHDGDVDADDIRAMTKEDAIEVYRSQWWERYGYGRIKYQDVATKVFDLSVNMGPRQAHKLLQRALKACEQDVKEDGILGPITRDAVNRTHRASLLPALRSEAAGFYRGLAQKTPDYRRYLNGWLNRAYH